MNEPNQEASLRTEQPLVNIIHELKPTFHYHLRADNPKLGMWLSIIPKMVGHEKKFKLWPTVLEVCIFPQGQRGKGTKEFYINSEDMAMNTEDPEFWEELKKYGERFIKLQELDLDKEEEVWKTVFPDIIEARKKREITKVR